MPNSPVHETLVKQIMVADARGIDVMPLYDAAGRPRGKSPIMWAMRIDIEPEISVEGANRGKAVWAVRGVAQDYAHYLDGEIRPGHVRRPELKVRGWTDALIERFLQVPDATTANPVPGGRGRPSLYLIERVEAIEQSDEFRRARKGAKKRREGARKGVETKAEAMQRWIEGIEITVAELPREVVIGRAITSHNARCLGTDRFRASRDDDWTFLARITVNYVRHELTRYDGLLEASRGRVGVGLAFDDISEKVFDEIANKYPWLADECYRQLRERRRRL